MGSGVSKKRKTKYEATVQASGGVDDTDDKRGTKKSIKSKRNKDSTLTEREGAKAKKETKSKSKKDKKTEKKQKTDKKKKKPKEEEHRIKEIEVIIKKPKEPAPPNVYHIETADPQDIRESTQSPYSREQRVSASVSEYSSLYEEEGNRNSTLDHMYVNEHCHPDTGLEESEYVTPDEVPVLPPKKNRKSERDGTLKKDTLKLPVSPPGLGPSAEVYENEDKSKSFIDQAPTGNEDSEESDSSGHYCDTELPQQPPETKPKPTPRPPGDDSPGVKVVVAIDFGTTFTGYAYSYVEEKDTIHMNPNWAGGKSASFKTPTWVALDKYNEIQAFGFDAQSAYNDETEFTDDSVNLYKEFKLQLMKKGSSEEVLVLQSEYGEPLPALKVFGAAMTFLKDRIIQRFKDAGKVFRPWQICWVLTVPAIWDDAQKLFMKEAAREAGLIRNVDDKHLLIALEPEAASLYCRTLKMNNFKGGKGDRTVQLSPGTVYIVLDAGGGTIDITVHEVLQGNRIAEIYQANGGPWGGSKINGSFETKLKGILGNEFVTYCQKENPGVWLDLILEFEHAKQSDAARPNSEKPLMLTLGLGLLNCYSEFSQGESLQTAINKYKDSGIRINKQGKLEVSPENVRSMFSSVVRKTVDHMRSILQRPEISKASVIFIVGGFGQCPYLQEEVKKHFQDRSRDVLIPTEGNLCVVKGAVMFGHQPDFMSSRIARYTYAYQNMRLYDASTDKGRESVEGENGDQIVLCLTPIIKKGEIVDYTEERSVEFDVVTEEFKLPIYCSESEKVDDPVAADVIQMGELHIILPNSSRKSQIGQAEKVKVTFTLSTELRVKGTHLASNTVTETRLQMKKKRKK